jgi:hypothetical protein
MRLTRCIVIKRLCERDSGRCWRQRCVLLAVLLAAQNWNTNTSVSVGDHERSGVCSEKEITVLVGPYVTGCLCVYAFPVTCLSLSCCPVYAFPVTCLSLSCCSVLAFSIISLSSKQRLHVFTFVSTPVLASTSELKSTFAELSRPQSDC